MEWNLHPRIIGACLVGFALVAGAYVLSTFGESNFRSQPAAVAVAAAPRVAIAVTDNDNNGIEDWRDEFITTKPIILDPIDSTYEPPTTLTGQLGIDFFEDYIRSKSAGPFGSSQEEVIERAVETMSAQAVYTLYDSPDITIMTTWDNDDIVTYANTVALVITNNNIADSRGEIAILSDALSQVEPDIENIEELAEIAAAYQNMRDQTLAIPVPAFAAKQHLDLVNTYHALYESITAMAISIEDPAFALIRIKRYQDDATGLRIALQNMYDTFEPYASLLGPDDPALLFVLFSPEFNSN